MLFISITRLRLRSMRFLPGFALHAVRSLGQAKKAAGFKGGALLADRAWTFWTMTSWESQQAMRDYMTAGRHRAAMPQLLDWCDEASVVHWEQPEPTPPAWPEADRQMRAIGRPSKVRFPSPRHQNLTYRSPRLTAGGQIKPAATRRPPMD